MNRNHYLPTEDYARLVDTLATTAKLDLFDRADRANAIKIALGEIGSIWPATIKRKP